MAYSDTYIADAGQNFAFHVVSDADCYFVAFAQGDGRDMIVVLITVGAMSSPRAVFIYETAYHSVFFRLFGYACTLFNNKSQTDEWVRIIDS